MRSFIYFIVLASLPLAVRAEQATFKPNDGAYGAATPTFQEIQKRAIDLNHAIADYLRTPSPQTYPTAKIAAFGRFVREEVPEKLGASIANYPHLGEQLIFFEDRLSKATYEHPRMPLFEVTRVPGQSTHVYSFKGYNDHEGSISGTDETAVITDLRNAIDPYQVNANESAVQKFDDQIQPLVKDWNSFFTDGGRPQTFWDISLTTLLEYSHIKKDYLVSPPERQWFILHPNVVVEDLRGAPAGQKTRGAVAIEWVGVNWWHTKFPVGVSLASLYSDRANVTSVGHGVCIYLQNKYCIGWASHGGRSGFYFSLDAVQFVQDKQKKVDDYVGKVRSVLGN